MSILNTQQAVYNAITRVAKMQSLELPEFDNDTEVIDGLGFNSMALASLIANVEDKLGFDPFRTEMKMISDIRTVGDLVDAYHVEEEALA